MITELQPKTVAYLGPAGTFTHQAALAAGFPPADLLPVNFDLEVLSGIDSGNYSAGVIALENSLEGVVGTALDQLLLRTENCLIQDEIILSISFDLFRHPEDDQPLIGVASHRIALGQCSQFISDQNLEQRDYPSTAAACQEVKENFTPGWGALGPRIAGSIYGLRSEYREVENKEKPQTRFVIIGTDCPPASAHDRTALALIPPRDESGSLVQRLAAFSKRNINLTTIRSRPLDNALGNYLFFIECSGHINDPDVAAAIEELLNLPGQVRFLGSFPSKLATDDGHSGQAALFSGDQSLEQCQERVRR